MDIITTSLEALIQRATNVHNQGPDTAAIDAFCGLINKEPECTQAASKFIIAKAHSLKEWEALQALLLLENCMKRCGVWFHSEVGKFRFLNELIKLVSPKYLGAHTPESVKRRVLELMSSWSTAFPNQAKIKEAYVMLKKQGVVQEVAPPPAPAPAPAPAPTTVVEPRERSSSIFQDEEKSLLLQKLLKSNNPVDLQAANRLIKTMVKEDEKRVEEKWRRRVELETVVNNCLLLREMLSSYENGTSSSQDIELINELHTTCTNLRPVLIRLANNPDPAFTCDVLSANDELGEVLAKYKEVMSSGVRPSPQQSALLDLTSPERPTAPLPSNPLQGVGVSLIQESANTTPSIADTQSTSLDDILGLVPTTTTPVTPSIPQSSHLNKNMEPAPPAKPKGLQELDLLGENMLKEILSNSGQQQTSKRNSAKISMNELLLNGSSQNNGNRPTGSDLVNESEHDDLLGRLSPAVSSDSGYAASSNNSTLQGTLSLSQCEASVKNDEPLLSLGDIDTALESLGLNDIATVQPDLVVTNESTSESHQTETPLSNVNVVESESTASLQDNESDDVNLLGSPAISQPQDSPRTPASLSDISVSIDTIKPSGVPPWTALSDADGVTIVVTLASDRPRPDVSVFVISTTNKSKQALNDFELRPIVPKRCKARLLAPTNTMLPPFNPFLPPAAIIQIMLIASYSKEPINLKLVINYMMDEESVTDIGQVDQLRLTE